MADTTATEKKVRSIRADEETFARFKEICEQAGGQQEALTALISNFELNQAKSTLPGQSTLIDDFKARIDGVISAYINALELSVNTEERVRADFRLNIDTQAKTIADLQEKNEKLKTELKNTKSEYETAVTEKDSAITELTAEYNSASEKARTADKQREQAEQIANMVTEQVQALKAEIENLRDKAEQSDSYKIKFEQLSAEVKRLQEQLKAEKENWEKEIEITKREQETAIRLAIADTKEQYQSKIDAMQEEHSRQISELLAQKSNSKIAKSSK